MRNDHNKPMNYTHNKSYSFQYDTFKELFADIKEAFRNLIIGK